jgi:hypothetical protein
MQRNAANATLVAIAGADGPLQADMALFAVVPAARYTGNAVPDLLVEFCSR